MPRHIGAGPRTASPDETKGQGMREQTIDVLIGGYLSTEAAHEDYEAVLKSGARVEGAVVVSKDLEGNLSVEQTTGLRSLVAAAHRDVRRSNRQKEPA